MIKLTATTFRVSYAIANGLRIATVSIERNRYGDGRVKLRSPVTRKKACTQGVQAFRNGHNQLSVHS